MSSLCAFHCKKSENAAPIVETASLLTGTRDGRLWKCRLRFMSSGGPSRVEFDWAFVIDREERFGDVLGFYHTHPFGPGTPSPLDIRTMRAWCDCLGKPILCVIGVRDSTSGRVRGYLFRSNRSRGRSVVTTRHGINELVFSEREHV